jgi:CRP/FNR family transcriptional regulator, cyclic AMP receptor protein
VPPSPTTGRDVLRTSRLFSGMDDATLDLCSQSLRERRFRPGEVIFHAGDPADSMFIVVEGQVRIQIPSEEGTEPAILTTVRRGGSFGELALLDGAPRSASAEAIDAVLTVSLRREAVEQLLDDEPAVRRAMFVALAGEIRRLTDQLEDLHFLDLPGRLARQLLRVTASDSTLTRGEIRRPWPYTQTELAGMIGGSRQSVNRLLADFTADGVIRFEGGDLVIPDPERLEARARR